MSALLGVSCLRSDIQEGVLEEILSLPLSRLSYLCSRILGTWIIVMSYYILSLFLAVLVFGIEAQKSHILASLFIALDEFYPHFIPYYHWGVFLTLFSRLWGLLMTLLLSGFLSYANEMFGTIHLKGISQINNVSKGIYAILHSLFPHIGTFNTTARIIWEQ